jgi:hypothetical protein
MIIIDNQYMQSVYKVQGVYNEMPWFFKVLRVSYILQEFKFPPKFLGYLTGHHWGAVVISCKDGVSSGEGTSCVVL